MRLASLSFVGGAVWLQQQASLPAWRELAQAIAVLAGIALLLRCCPSRMGLHRVVRHLLLLCCAVVAGFFWAAMQAQMALALALQRQDEGRDLHVSGLIDSLPYRTEQGVRFNFRIERVLSGTVNSVPQHISLGWYHGLYGVSSLVPDLKAGQRWEFTVRLQRPHGNANPYGYDYEVWLLEQGLRATGYVRKPETARLLDAFVPCGVCLVEALRGVLRSRIEQALAGQRYGAVMVALVVGDQHGIRQPDWLIYTRSGISHLISISGLHVTMIAGLFAMLAGQLWRRSFFTAAQLPLLLPAQKVAALAGAVAACAYVLLAGFGVPAQRTLYMLLVVALALWNGRIAALSHVLACALLLVVALDPWAVLWPGFWLSFGAVAVLVYAGGGRAATRDALPVSTTGLVEHVPGGRKVPTLTQRWRVILHEASHAQYAVTLGLVPLTMLLFAQFSLLSPLANAVAIPLVSLIITPLALLGSVVPEPACTWLLQLAHGLFALLACILEWLVGFPLAVWRAPMPPFTLFVWALIGTLWLLAPRGWSLRWLGLASWIPLLIVQPTAPVAGAMRVIAFDVGQGMAVLVETANHRLLYDAGPAYGADANAGSRTILPYLQGRGITALDRLIVSHSDTDHAGGALALLTALPETALWSSLAAGHSVRRAARHTQACSAGQQWDWDGVHFEMLHPLVAAGVPWGIRANTVSCVLRISSPAGSLLLAGDIEAGQERALVQRYGKQLRSSVLLVPHHGSNTSSTAEFLQAVQPRHALFQLGYRNRYHHPHPAVWSRYAAQDIARWRTDETGAIELNFDATLQITAYRQHHARYWYGQ
ncbi:DNA internalization-related competence protein ComEC/Rec2 [Pseudoduganella sp. CY13W]|uniref:DNA internalization-related competence protein ComEC/Rec2 n=2 Tax=Duganella qianjiadongensis TaxID=2692176 RepID=A0ABW9VN44_9BURK|nr:DNA internalization-related competence protein ComEC/Rec2 [Duganella qianjiadongensis]